MVFCTSAENGCIITEKYFKKPASRQINPKVCNVKHNRLLLVIFFVLSSLLAFYGVWIFSQNLNEEEPWTFAVICDIRGGSEYSNSNTGVNDIVLKAMAKDIVENGCDLVLIPGDLINGYSKDNNLSTEKQFENWKTAMSPVYNARIKVYTVRGNHESGGSIDPAFKDAYFQAFSADNPDNGPKGEKDLTYSFIHKNAFFIGIDEYADHHTHKVNQEWSTVS